ncbi:class I SAM-dependent methyltransferase [Streptomyces gobiensis]|uniref:class I SAM-dependent methyltransferase n=1 Tax=Streptomyces gobiensis TaxID=2875706 RepID=UPI001E5E083B|nr:class I SAM-dependent methyltransferase [Streptomyces gobiensis]UGY91013.1 class I SAM-dependent methyltransferase [Streptomyces gobiensis]
MVSSHRPLAGQAVLDLGAGTGVSSFALADAGARVVAVDASRPSLDLLKSRRRDHKIEVVEADFRDAQLDSKFNVITLSRNTFFLAQSHDEKIDLFRVIERHLKPEGAAFLDCSDLAEYLGAGGDATSVTYPFGPRADGVDNSDCRSRLPGDHEYLLGPECIKTHCISRDSHLGDATGDTTDGAMAGLEVASVNGTYAGEDYSARSREMLVVLERK